MHTLRGIELLVTGLLATSGLASLHGPNPTLEFEGKVGFSATADTLLECGGVAAPVISGSILGDWPVGRIAVVETARPYSLTTFLFLRLSGYSMLA